MHGLSIYVCDEISFVVYNIFSNSDFKIKKKKKHDLPDCVRHYSGIGIYLFLPVFLKIRDGRRERTMDACDLRGLRAFDTELAFFKPTVWYSST